MRSTAAAEDQIRRLAVVGGSGRGRGGALGKNVGGKEGKTMELPKHPFSVHVAGVKQEYHRAKLSGT